jgi:hypothetical protein
LEVPEVLSSFLVQALNSITVVDKAARPAMIWFFIVLQLVILTQIYQDMCQFILSQ